MLAKMAESETRNIGLTQQLGSMSQGQKDGNFLHLQISTEEMLDKLEHFYKGDYKAVVSGNIIWKKQTNSELITFNEFGVTSMMEIISKYVDKNTILSDYGEKRIYEIIGELGDELVLFLLCNYEKMGMDTYFKKTKFRLIVVTTLNVIETTYRRALRARTLEEVNQTKVVSQFGERQPQQPIPQRRENFLGRMMNRG